MKKLPAVLLLLMILSGCSSVTKSVFGPFQRKQRIYVYHTVKQGETLFRVSKYYYNAKTTAMVQSGIKKIKDANNFSTDSIYPGQRLYIPEAIRTASRYALLPPETKRQTVYTAKKTLSTKQSKPVPPATRPPEVKPIIKKGMFIWPVKGKLICKYGELGNTGIDILVEPASVIIASKEGTVCFSGLTSKHGNTIIIMHDDGFYSVYAHDLIIQTEKGKNVKQGDILGTIKSGSQNKRYLHFEIRKNDTPVDALLFLPREGIE